MKYNRLCKHPLELEKAEQLKKLLENDNQHTEVKMAKINIRGVAMTFNKTVNTENMESSAELIKWVLENLNY